MTNKNIPDFLTTYDELMKRLDRIDPIKYAKTRNFINGQITYLSPFITHGMISPKQIADKVLKNYKPKDAEKLLQELGWREFFHRVWQDKKDAIFDDLRFDQAKVVAGDLPVAITKAETGVKGIDEGLVDLFQTGYLHNHGRMWTASLVCNVAQTHWYQGAKWMYYHLLDGDLASNTLSWQWIAGTFSHKKYYANQENINKYAGTKQRDTIIDVEYEAFDSLAVPEILQARSSFELPLELPTSTISSLPVDDKAVCLYSIWNLDPLWKADIEAHRILLIEPSHFRDWPISPKRWEFILHWAKQIPDLEILVADFNSLNLNDNTQVYFREYPAIAHWSGNTEDREWLYPGTTGYFKNFFSFWKQAQKELPRR